MQNQITIAKITNIRIQHSVTGESIIVYPVENDVGYSFDSLVADVKMTNGPSVAMYAQQPGKIRIGAAPSQSLKDYIKRHRNISGSYRVVITDDSNTSTPYEASLTNGADIDFKANDHKVELNFSGKVIS